MYLTIMGVEHTVTKRIVKGKTVRYIGVTPEPEIISGTIEMYRDDGFIMSADDADSYGRKTYVGTLLEISNDPEPVPVEPVPSLDERVTALENAIKEGLQL